MWMSKIKAQKDWNILPLKENTKYPPLYKSWQEKNYPQSKLKEHKGNFAIATGMISEGLVVFDLDFRVSFNRKKEGIKLIYKEFEEKLPHLSNTLIVETPRGYHFYYIFKDDKVRNTSQKNISYDKKKFISQNSTRFGKYLAGLDTRANGGYVVAPPSEIDGKKYKFINEVEPIEITEEDYKAIFKFFELPEEEIAKNTIRQGFVDILEGKINPNDIATKENKEHVYWKELYHECYSVGLLPEDLLDGLEKFQKGFDLKKTKTQLEDQKNKDYIFNGKRMTKAKYNQYFNSHIDYIESNKPKPLLIEEEDKDLILPKTDLIIHYGPKDKIFIYSNEIIYLCLSSKRPYYEKILDCSFKIFSKCFHNKEVRYSYILNGQNFYTDTILDILRRAEPYLRKGLKGRDCLKEVIRYYDNQLEFTKPKEFLGFDNGWILPQTEEENNCSIIVITDYQQEAYDRAKNIIKEYSDEEKEKISKEIREFINITQIEYINLLILIGWTIASPFRLFFIKELDLFPILYNYGPPNTGRSSLEDFWIINFYRIYKSHLPPNTSIPRLEDHLSKSTFPYSLQDIKETNINRDLISMLQDYSTSIGVFERKKDAKTTDFIKYKIAGLNLDSNEILDIFTNPAINERQIFCEYTQKTELDMEWVDLRKKLKKYKLFSFLYKYTKDWTNKDIEKIYNPILEKFNDKFKYLTISSRLIKSAAIVKFGIDLFIEIFNLPKPDIDIKIIKTIMKGSGKMTRSTVAEFIEYCQITLKYYGKEDCPTYIDAPLIKKYFSSKNKSEDKEYYLFYNANNKGFKQFTQRNIGLDSLEGLLQYGLGNKEIIFQKSYNNKRCLRIDADWLDGILAKENNESKSGREINGAQLKLAKR